MDFNVVMTDKGDFVEVQGTGEEAPFSKEAMAQMLALGESGIQRLIEVQRAAIKSLEA